MGRVTWAPAALEDFHRIYLFLKQDAPGYARAFRDRVSRQARLLAQFPRMGQMVLEVVDPDVRQLRVQKFRLIYRVKGEDVEMYAILPGDTPLNL